MSDPQAAPPRSIYLIRHGEKPADPDVDGVDGEGSPDRHSLTPRGWQRSGALAVLFTRPPKPGATPLSTPDRLFAAGYGSGGKSRQHRAYQTLLGLSELIGAATDSSYEVGEEARLAKAVLALPVETVLVCWEHDNIPVVLDAIGRAVPVTSDDAGAPVPTQWPPQRFDLVWRLRRVDTAQAGATTATGYAFTSIPQAVLAGDESTAT